MPVGDESELLADAWAEVLEGEIPENYLDAAYVRAMRDKGTGFALSANDMVKGYRDVCESERNAPRIAQDANLLSGNVCLRCFGSGLEQYTDKGYKQVRRCDHIIPEDDSDIDSW